MRVSLGINTGFAINRFVEPDDWVRVVAEDLGLCEVQFTADLLNPFLPEGLVLREAERIRQCCEHYNVRVTSTFTSAFTRVNHLMHPHDETRAVWEDWFRRFFALSASLGARGAGSHFGILTLRDAADPAIRARRVADAIDAWRRLSEYAAELGLEYVMFEPMSVPREMAETIPATRALLDACTGFAVPMRLCLDVDHGDLQSQDPDDTDPHAWIRAFGAESPCIHIKQSLRDKGGHYPFTADYNARGKVIPEEILATLAESGAEETTLLLEISHRERWPSDTRVVQDLQESVAYWKPALAQLGAAV